MLMPLESAAIDTEFPNVLVVTAIDGTQMRYLMRDGLLYPGRIWRSMSPDGHQVSFFLPIPDGQPEVIQVKGCQDVSRV